MLCDARRSNATSSPGFTSLSLLDKVGKVLSTTLIGYFNKCYAKKSFEYYFLETNYFKCFLLHTY